MAHALNSTPFEFNFLGRIRNVIDALQARRARRLAFNQAYAELQSLSDRELSEFGLCRSGLWQLAKETADKA